EGREDRARAIRHRVRRIGDVRIEGILRVSLGRLVVELPAGLEIELPRRDDGLWRPGVVVPPHIRARLERGRLGKLERSLILEPIGEPRRLNVLPEVRRGRTAEVDGAEVLPS